MNNIITGDGSTEFDSGARIRTHTRLLLVDVVRFDKRQDISFQFITNKLDVSRFSLIVDNPRLFEFWEMSMVKGDSDALSVFVGHPFRVFVPDPVCNAFYERIICQ